MDRQSCILVTGSSGVLGTGLLSALKNAGYFNILAPSRSELDILDDKKCKEFFREKKPDYVFHLASIVYGLKGNDINQWQALVENTQINQNFFMACAESRVRKIFFAGTVAGYPLDSPLPLNENNFWGGLPHFGEFGYSMSKKHAYSYLEIMRKKFGIPYCYGVFTNIFGKNDRFNTETGHVIPSLIKRAFDANSSGRSLEVWGAPDTTRDFIYNADAGDAALFAMNNLEGLVNISTSEEISMERVVKAIVSNFSGLKYYWNESMPIGISRRYVSNNKLVNAGWIRKHKFEDAIEETINWYRNNKLSIRQ